MCEEAPARKRTREGLTLSQRRRMLNTSSQTPPGPVRRHRGRDYPTEVIYLSESNPGRGQPQRALRLTAVVEGVGPSGEETMVEFRGTALVFASLIEARSALAPIG